jgi:hypothetical protein
MNGMCADKPGEDSQGICASKQIQTLCEQETPKDSGGPDVDATGCAWVEPTGTDIYCKWERDIPGCLGEVSDRMCGWFADVRCSDGFYKDPGLGVCSFEVNPPIHEETIKPWLVRPVKHWTDQEHTVKTQAMRSNNNDQCQWDPDSSDTRKSSPMPIFGPWDLNQFPTWFAHKTLPDDPPQLRGGQCKVRKHFSTQTRQDMYDTVYGKMDPDMIMGEGPWLNRKFGSQCVACAPGTYQRAPRNPGFEDMDAEHPDWDEIKHTLRGGSHCKDPKVWASHDSEGIPECQHSEGVCKKCETGRFNDQWQKPKCKVSSVRVYFSRLRVPSTSESLPTTLPLKIIL